MANNLVFLERFNGDLSAWTLDQTGGTVSIVTQDFSTKMKLNDTSASGIVSAARSFTEPSGKWIIETDLYYAASAVGIVELLDASNNPIVTVDCGSTANICSFSTNLAAASTATFNSARYKQIILVVNNTAHTVACYISEDIDNSAQDSDHGSLLQIGGSKSYSNAVIAKVRFKTGVGTTGIVYVDEVKVYTPDLFVIGDSITDGKRLWSGHPQSTYRLAAAADENSPPHWHLAKCFGGTSNVWVANRGFGGSTTGTADSYIQAAVIDHGAARVFIGEGHNDIVNAVSIATMQTNFNSIISKLQAAGITGSNIIIGNVIPGSDFNTDALKSKRRQWNTWLYYKAVEIGAVFVDNDQALRDPASWESILAAYVGSDNIHLVSAGSLVMAKTIWAAMDARNTANILKGAYPSNDERLFPRGFYVPVGGNSIDFGFPRGVSRRIFSGGY